MATGPIGFKYYTYILVFNDVILILDKSQKKYMDMLEDYYTLKLWIIEEPKSYVGINIAKLYYPNCFYLRTMISKSYKKETIKNVKKGENQSTFQLKTIRCELFAPNPFLWYWI